MLELIEGKQEIFLVLQERHCLRTLGEKHEEVERIESVQKQSVWRVDQHPELERNEQTGKLNHKVVALPKSLFHFLVNQIELLFQLSIQGLLQAFGRGFVVNFENFNCTQLYVQGVDSIQEELLYAHLLLRFLHLVQTEALQLVLEIDEQDLGAFEVL